jgi:alanine dehydrogenase
MGGDAPMIVGIPTEIKADEFRVALTPAGARELTDSGHTVLVQRGAGAGSGFADGDYRAQGASVAPDAEAVFAEAELIVKVKEPQPAEVSLLRAQQTLFTYLHLAPDPPLTRALAATGTTCVAYETVTDRAGRLPLLAPMSEVAGRLAAQAGAFMLQRPLGGRGTLIGGVPGVPPARVLVIGGGVVGTNAAVVAAGMGAAVTIFDSSLERLRELDRQLGSRLVTHHASALAIEESLPQADLVIGAVLVRGARAPFVVRRSQLETMKSGAVLVDVSIDQGGCFETSRPTTHSEPTFELDGIVHYCVANMPGAVPITSTHALTNATLPYVLLLAGRGLLGATQADSGLRAGVTLVGGHVTSAPVATATGELHLRLDEALLELPAAA